MWLYRSPVGTFHICQRKGTPFGLFLNGEFLGDYPDPEAAAGDVITGTTGADPWDNIYSDVDDVPSGLIDWEYAP